jgi:hypothetical protein
VRKIITRFGRLTKIGMGWIYIVVKSEKPRELKPPTLLLFCPEWRKVETN